MCVIKCLCSRASFSPLMLFEVSDILNAKKEELKKVRKKRLQPVCYKRFTIL